MRNILPPFLSQENFKNMILSSLGYLEVTTPEGKEESKRKEREPAESPSVYLSSSSPSGLLCSCRVTAQISDASSWCGQMQRVHTRVYAITSIPNNKDFSPRQLLFHLSFDKNVATTHNRGLSVCYHYFASEIQVNVFTSIDHIIKSLLSSTMLAIMIKMYIFIILMQ